MRRGLAILGCLWLAVPAAGQQVVDRIVARVNGEILTESEVRDLGRFQQLVESRADSDSELLNKLIEQWIVRADAAAANFPAPAEAQVTRALERLEKQFSSPEAYRARLAELGLTETAVRRLLAQQIYLSRYLDYKFRPAAQADQAQIAKYYREEFVPQLKARGQPVPPLENVQEQIRELLVQRDISERATRWVEETKSRLRVVMADGDSEP